MQSIVNVAVVPVFESGLTEKQGAHPQWLDDLGGRPVLVQMLRAFFI